MKPSDFGGCAKSLGGHQCFVCEADADFASDLSPRERHLVATARSAGEQEEREAAVAYLRSLGSGRYAIAASVLEKGMHRGNPNE